MVTPHELATLTALRILLDGGNAVDAAVAANAVLGVVAPETCGPGGDLFALVHREGDDRPAALNASGRAGSGADAEALRAEGLPTVPYTHRMSVTAPGCVDGWASLLERYGSIALSQVLTPAIGYADEGFAVSAELAGALTRRLDELADEPSAQPLLPRGGPPSPGTHVSRPDLAKTLRDLADGGRQAFYEGRAGQTIVEATREVLTVDDLARPHAEWVEPLGLRVHGRTGWTTPPNSPGYVTLAAAWLLAELEPVSDLEDPDYLHLMVEAYRAAAWDRDDLVCDPGYAPLSAEALLDEARLRTRLKQIDRRATVTWPAHRSSPGGTAYLCVTDDRGLAVSLIQSNFTGFGSGITAADSGIFLQNRGAGFSLIEGHPNEMAPGKRPQHTLSPTLWTRDGSLDLLLGTRGGHYQPQLLLQTIAHLFHLESEPAEAQALPRWILDSPTESRLLVEGRLPETTVAGLRERRHRVSLAEDFEFGWGPISMIRADENGLRTAAADPRVATTSAAVL